MAEFVELFAYEFESDLAMPAMLERVRAATDWHWMERENDRWGDYFLGITRPSAEYPPERTGNVKLIDLGGGKFALNVKYKSTLPDAEADFANLDTEIRDSVLSTLRARGIERAEDYE